MNLSRKCCSQSEEGIVVGLDWVGLGWRVLVRLFVERCGLSR